MSEGKIYSLLEMRAANDGKFSEVEYIHYVFNAVSMDGDLGSALCMFFEPELVEVEGRLLVPAVGACERYRDFRLQNRSSSEAQFWANLIEISDLFGDIGYERAKSMGRVLEKCWQLALDKKKPGSSQRATMFEDEDECEVFVTVAAAEIIELGGVNPRLQK